MQSEFYPFQSKNHCQLFEFESVSEWKCIRKQVIFRALPGEPKLYNLALIDILENGDTSDAVVSDNSDMRKVMATVIHCLLRFLEYHPFASVYIRGNSASRMRLYRAIISREISEVKNILEIYGKNGTKIELFRSNTNYEAFLIKQKTL
ncbi:DUF6934 family protein [Dyadobacter sp. MSC1_007]|jgi:hypothetical protein|uniref:DUF6934 family protein n=1 Tax=Dyadobacter sp. MSC1_007 TaxID=2909264 RepID=UPI002030A09E|nr:hypothetical protein [Dyadobacter sp. MSC1_007]